MRDVAAHLVDVVVLLGLLEVEPEHARWPHVLLADYTCHVTSTNIPGMICLYFLLTVIVNSLITISFKTKLFKLYVSPKFYQKSSLG